MNELVIGGVALAPLIVGLIEAAKRFGLPMQYAPWLALALSAGAYALASWAAADPGNAGIAGQIVGILATFLGSVGMYHGLKRGLPDRPQSQAPKPGPEQLRLTRWDE